MGSEYVQIKCGKCKKWVVTGAWNGELDEPIEEYISHDCDVIPVMLKFSEMEDAKAFLIVAESELESANYHSQIESVGELYRAVLPYVEKSKELNVAKAIAEAFIKII